MRLRTLHDLPGRGPGITLVSVWYLLVSGKPVWGTPNVDNKDERGSVARNKTTAVFSYHWEV